MAHWDGTAEPAVETKAMLLTGGVDEQQFTLPRTPAALGPSNGNFKALDAVLRAEASAAAPSSDSQEPARDLGEIAPPASTLFLPTAKDAGWSKSSELNMHDSSVEIEPAAAPADASGVEAAPAFADQFDRPFEPAGLFLDMSGSDGFAGPAPEKHDEGDVAEAVAGPRHKSPQGAA